MASDGSQGVARPGGVGCGRPGRRRPLVFLSLLLAAAALLGAAPRAHALCNIIPPAERSFPSTQGSVTSPIVAPGDEVTLSLSACDDGPGFAASPAANQITITFLPAGDPQAVVTVTSGITVPPADCAAGSGPCLTLRFTMPQTTSATYPDGLAGPAEIRVTSAGAAVATIGPLFQPRDPATTCDKQAETVFRQFTVLPAPNVFQTLIDQPSTRVLAALDGSGSLLVPFDYRDVLPLGPAEPVAALLSGSTTVDAFASAPGVPIVVPDSAWVRSFTIDGRPVPPLLRATDAGNQVFGASDGAAGIVRVARTLGGAPPIFDLQYLRTSNGRGPVVIPAGRWTVAPGAAIPLANLRSTSAAAAFARDESLEGNLNGAPFSADSDLNDDVVQIIDVATFTSTLTGMAASPTHNPIVGGAVVETAGDLVALLESEAQQGGSDLNADGQPATDDVLRVLTTTGVTLTPAAPAAALVGSPFPGIDRRPLAIDGTLVYFREPEVGFQARSGAIEQGLDVAVSPDGRLIATTNPTGGAGCGEVRVRRRDGESGGFLPSPAGTRTICGATNGANGVVVSPSGRMLYVAAPSASSVGAFQLSIAPDQIGVGGGISEKIATDGVSGVDGLQAVSRLAITPPTPDGTVFGPRVSLYALAPGESSITAFNVSESSIVAMPTLAFVKTLKDQVGCTPTATRGCISNFADARNLAVSPDGKHVYVAVHGSSRIKGFTRNTNSAEIVPLGEWIDGANGGTLLGGAIDVAVSPDGRFVYALADTDPAITIFSRDAGTGLLTFVGNVVNGPGVEGLNLGKRILVSPDGRALVVSNGNGLVVVFDRHTATGALIFNRQRGVGPSGLATANIAISPDSEHVYLEKNNQDSGDVFARESRLRAFDASTGQTRPGLDALNTSAKLASVSTGRAAYVRPTTVFGSPFPVVSLYDATTDSAQTLDGLTAIASKLALSSQILAVGAPESQVGNADGDSVTTEDTLLVVSTANPSASPTVVGVDAIDIDATDVCAGGASAGEACVSAADCPGGSCQGVAVASKVRALDFDGGQDDALSVYRFGSPGAIEIGRNVVDFQVRGNLVAFRDSENGLFRLNCNDPAEIAFDNDDGDCSDLVMRIYDLKTGQTIDTRQATIKCEQPGCEPGLPYKILGDAVAFLTREVDQGNQDLDGDGDTDDTVVQVWDVRSGHTQVVPSRSGTVLPPLPTEFLGAPIVYRETLESDIGRDVNEDGDQSDVVVLVDGDSDGDGVFDATDLCVETADASQLDSDADGLGDACDPTPYCGIATPAAPPPAPAAANACQGALGKATQTFVKSFVKAVTGCLDDVAAGRITGDPDALCRGLIAVPAPILPANPKTALQIARASDLLQRAIDAKCDAVKLAQLDACATTPSGVAQCLTAQAAIAAIQTTTVGYGAVVALGDAQRLRCQKAIGKQTTTYLAAVGTAMRTCLDRVNDGALAGDAQALCLGAEAPTGATPPQNAQTQRKLELAAQRLVKSLARPCAGALPAPLDSCGDDAAGIAACARCVAWREAIGGIRASYGPHP